MSYVLSAIKQVRFLVNEGATGLWQIVINRPGYTDLVQAATDTLILTDSIDPTWVASGTADYSPFVEGDLQLSKKFTTTKGRRALDDVNVVIRDSYGYVGTINGSDAHEKFSGDYLTFFDVWFSDLSAPYLAFLGWKDAATGLVEVCHEGWIDANYKPSTDPDVKNVGTAQQIWLASRTLKLTAVTQTNKTWLDVLSLIAAIDCQEGVPYNGFFFYPSANGRSNTRANAFGGGSGSWYQAVPFIDRNTNRFFDLPLVGLPASVWPTTPWQTQLTGQIQDAHWSGGTGYAVNDTVTVNGGTVLAAITILGVSGTGAVTSFKFTNAGSDYTTGSHATTNVVSFSGSGFTLNITRVGNGALYGPSGNNHILLTTLFTKISIALGLSAFVPSDLASALDFFAQRADNTALNFPVDASPLNLENIWINLNVFAQAHPFDGSYWPNPVGFAPDTSIPDVLTGLCNFLLSDYNTVYASDGSASLQTKAMGATGATIPTSWVGVGQPSEDDSDSGPRIVTIHNRADSLSTQCPLGIVGDALDIEVPIRLHRIGNTSGTNPVNDKECFIWDSSLPMEEQYKCFQVAWLDNSGNPALNPDCWKGLCYAYWYQASNTNVVYPTTWNPFPKYDGSAGTWAHSFYVVNAVYKNGDHPSANLQGEIKGGSYFNSRDYHAVAFAALNLPLPTVQTILYFGVSDDTGSVQAVGTGMAGNWRYGLNATQDWRAIELTQLLRDGTTEVKWQAQPTTGAFPYLTDLPFGPVSGGGTTSATGGGNTGTAGVQTVAPTDWNSVFPAALTTNQNNWTINETGKTRAWITSTSNVQLTGITLGVQDSQLILINTGANKITLVSQSGVSATANQFLFSGQGANPLIGLGPNGVVELLYDSAVSKWRVLSVK